jgi:DNA-3-methyladenine glycosylase
MGRPGRVLPRSFYARPADVVAPELLGCVVETETPEGLVAVRLTEVEAYAGEDDPASHAWRGPTPRTEVMFGPQGHVYVYFTYGMHWCANLVCASDDVAAAVLLRAGEVVEGGALARERRGPKPPLRRLASGPANLASALGLDGAWHGRDVTHATGAIRVRRGPAVAAPELLTGPRVGITRAVDVPWRFSLRDDPTVSPPRPRPVAGA